MRIRNEIIIAGLRERVCELYCSQALLPHWSPGFISLTHVGGVCGTEGAVYRQVYRFENRQMDELITLQELTLPERLRVVADLGGGNRRDSVCCFEAVDEGRTRMIVVNKFSGPILPHLVAEELEAYTQNFLELFRVFVGSQPS